LHVAGQRGASAIALARHNHLSFGHPRAGRNFAQLYSLVGSCIANDVEPTGYLTDVLPRIRDATTDERLARSALLDVLTPSVPRCCAARL
jgi:hypothetical protein